MIASNNLDTDWQPFHIEAGWRRECWTSSHRNRQHTLHPFVIGFHLSAGNFFWPIQISIKRKQLRCRRDEVVVLRKKSAHSKVPLGSHSRGRSDVESRKLQSALDLKDGLRFHQGAF